MILSCLCATHNRQAFMPWLAWVYNQIDWDGPKELVLVDSTPGLGHVHPVSGLVPEDELVFVPSGEPGIAPKYQQALENARGDVVFWLDDDDYHVPDAALRCLPYLDEAHPVVYPKVKLFWVRTTDGAVRDIDCLWWGAGLYDRKAILACPGFFGKSMCAEIRWIKRLCRILRFAEPELGYVGFCLSHRNNISNRVGRTAYRFRYSKNDDWSHRLGLNENHRQELLFQLGKLKERIG